MEAVTHAHELLALEQKLCGCSSGKGMHLTLPVPPSFCLEKAVCSYGFFMTAPNAWIPSSYPGAGLLERPLRLASGQAVVTVVFQTSVGDGSVSNLVVCLRGVQQLSDADRECISNQIARMLRLSEKEESALAAFHSVHSQAKAEGFGRLFRSPTLFEDMVKSLLLCNCGWVRTLAMAKALCEIQAELKGPPLGWFTETLMVRSKQGNIELLPPQTPEGRDLKRKRMPKKRAGSKVCKSMAFTREDMTNNIDSGERVATTTVSPEILPEIGQRYGERECSSVALSDSDMTARPCYGAFPLPEELATLDVKFLASRCGLGYRAKRIWKLAKDICEGKVDLKSFEIPAGQLQIEDVRKGLLQLQGFGPFTCANVLMCVGDYGTIPADTETVRHLKQVHRRTSCTLASVSKDVTKVYAHWAPFQFLAYWFELWGAYEEKFGPLNRMDPHDYGRITGHNMRNKVQKNLQDTGAL